MHVKNLPHYVEENFYSLRKTGSNLFSFFAENKRETCLFTENKYFFGLFSCMNSNFSVVSLHDFLKSALKRI